MTQREKIEELAERLVNQIETLITDEELEHTTAILKTWQGFPSDGDFTNYLHDEITACKRKLKTLQASLKGKQAVEAKIKEIEELTGGLLD